jgi:hypothetical protein
MASTIVEFDFAPGATVNIELYAAQSDTIVNGAGGDSGTEETNRGGTYLATVTQALTGWHKAYATVSSTTMPIGWVNLTDDTGTYEVDRIAQPAGVSVSADIAAVKVDTAATLVDTVQIGTAGAGLSNITVAALASAAVTDIWSTDTIPEAYAADGSAGTPAQLLYLIQQAINEFAISSTTKTIKKLDGSTTAATGTLDDATNPTSITRAS